MFLRRKAISTTADEDLVLAVRSGHQAALGTLWDRYAHLLLGVGMKYLKDGEAARDAVVDLFTALPDLLKKHDVERFKPWVHTVMRNRCLLVLRNTKRTTDTIEERADEEEAEELILHEQELQRLEQAMSTLNEAQRMCITLFHLERCCYTETAERTGYTVEQVRSHLQNGRRNL
ncbi:MAG TPA: sigma-70 family RNA polymerase sigma factor, partial [Flavobacteriales bacterium]|nr:sigma-70 family RNA polymerase sigma factor [Flavobacteriales bacterium]